MAVRRSASRRGFEYFVPAIVNRSQSLNRVEIRNHTVEQVPVAFNHISDSGDNLALWCDEVIRGNEYGRYDVLVAGGKSNHFQGIQRLHAPQAVALSGSHKEEGIAQLFIGELATCHASLPWRSNRYLRKRPDNSDKIKLVIGINADEQINATLGLSAGLWHAGGIAASGDVLAVPLEGDAPGLDAKVVFFDVSEPTQPRVFRMCLTRPDLKAGCVALTGWESGLMLAAVLSKNSFARQQLDFYLFDSRSLVKPDSVTPFSWDSIQCLAAPGSDGVFNDYENIQFVQETGGQLYLVGMRKPGTFNDLNPNAGEADLFRVDFWSPPGTWTSPGQFSLRLITKLGTRRFPTSRKFDFDAGSSVFVDICGGMSIYSCFDFRESIDDRNFVNFVEFRPNSSRYYPDAITTMADAWVEMYENKNFGGRCLGLVGLENRMLMDLSDIYVGEEMLNNQVSSIRYQLPSNRKFRLFNEKNCSVGGGYLDLTGFEGRVIVRADLQEQDFDDRVSSACAVPENS